MEYLYPLGMRILVLPDEVSMRTESGLYATTDAHKEIPHIGTVAEVGPGEADGDVWKAPSVKIGNRIMYVKYSGTIINLNGKTYVVLKETDILGFYRKE